MLCLLMFLPIHMGFSYVTSFRIFPYLFCFITMIKTHFENFVKYIRSDSSGGYMSTKFHELLAS